MDILSTEVIFHQSLLKNGNLTKLTNNPTLPLPISLGYEVCQRRSGGEVLRNS